MKSSELQSQKQEFGTRNLEIKIAHFVQRIGGKKRPYRMYYLAIRQQECHLSNEQDFQLFDYAMLHNVRPVS